jgi:hypothetical protein
MKGSDNVIRVAESIKLRAYARFSCPVQSSATRRLIPLALNHLRLRGGHFRAILKEFATINGNNRNDSETAKTRVSDSVTKVSDSVPYRNDSVMAAQYSVTVWYVLDPE